MNLIVKIFTTYITYSFFAAYNYICHSNKNARRYPRLGMKETKSVTRPKIWMIVTHDNRHWISLTKRDLYRFHSH